MADKVKIQRDDPLKNVTNAEWAESWENALRAETAKDDFIRKQIERGRERQPESDDQSQ